MLVCLDVISKLKPAVLDKKSQLRAQEAANAVCLPSLGLYCIVLTWLGLDWLFPYPILGPL